MAGRVDDDADHRLTVETGGQGHAVRRHLKKEVGGPVEGVGHPRDVRRPVVRGALLAQDRIAGAGAPQLGDYVGLGGAVCLGHEVGGRALGTDMFQVHRRVGLHELGGSRGHPEGDLLQFVEQSGGDFGSGHPIPSQRVAEVVRRPAAAKP